MLLLFDCLHFQFTKRIALNCPWAFYHKIEQIVYKIMCIAQCTNCIPGKMQRMNKRLRILSMRMRLLYSIIKTIWCHNFHQKLFILCFRHMAISFHFISLNVKTNDKSITNRTHNGTLKMPTQISNVDVVVK